MKVGVDPGYETGVALPKKQAADTEIAIEDATDAERDLAQLARDQIERKIASSFTGHDFTRFRRSTRSQVAPMLGWPYGVPPFTRRNDRLFDTRLGFRST